MTTPNPIDCATHVEVLRGFRASVLPFPKIYTGIYVYRRVYAHNSSQLRALRFHTRNALLLLVALDRWCGVAKFHVI